MAGTLIDRFRTSQPELGISDREASAVRLAGLLHDLGHGPFSHVFDNEFMSSAAPGMKWHHEQASTMMLDYLIDDNAIDIDASQTRLIKELILASEKKGVKRDRSFLYEIVANGRTGVDVDKFDYLARDCLNLGIKSSYDYSRLMTFSRVINDQICYHSKEVFNLYEMFHTRYSLHKQVYSHRVGKAIEYMVTDAMLLADPYLKIAESARDPERFMNLTDSVLKQIEISKAPELAASREIIRSIRTRNLYKFVDEVLFAPDVVDRIPKHAVTPANIATAGGEDESGGPAVDETDIILQWMTLSYSMKDENPVDKMRFFSRWEADESFAIPRERVSFLVPDRFSERYLRVFTRDPEKVQSVQRAFRRWLRQFSASSENPAFTIPDDWVSSQSQQASSSMSPRKRSRHF